MPNVRFIKNVVYSCAGSNAYRILSYIAGSYRNIQSGGLVFDVIFGIETLLNLISDVVLFKALNTWKLSATKNKLILFLVWNSGTTIFCYGASLFAARFLSANFPLDKNEFQDVNEGQLRGTMFYLHIFSYTVLLIAKGGILYGVYAFYANHDRLVAEADQAEAAGPHLARLGIAGAPQVAYRFEVPGRVGALVQWPGWNQQMVGTPAWRPSADNRQLPTQRPFWIRPPYDMPQPPAAFPLAVCPCCVAETQASSLAQQAAVGPVQVEPTGRAHSPTAIEAPTEPKSSEGAARAHKNFDTHPANTE